jgi:TonB family protein
MNGASGWSALFEAMPWIDTLGLSLLHFLWQGVLVGAAYYLVRAMLPVARSEARYWVGIGALAMLAACPVATFFALRPTTDVAQVLPGVDVAQPLAAFAGAMSGSEPVWQTGLPWLVVAWCAGVLFMAWRALRDWRGLERVAHHMAERNLELERRLARLARRLDVAQRVRVLVSTHIDTPSLIGWLRPVILLPAAVVIGLPRHQLELILSHELGHLRRCDHLVNLAQALVETLLFYHPVVHWISRDVRHEREVCCDRLVLRASSDEPREYARALAALEEMRHVPAQLALAANGGMLVDRVRRIVGVPVPRVAATHSAIGMWLLASAGLAVVAMSLQLRQQHDPVAAAVVVPPVSALASAVPDAVGLAGLALRLPTDPVLPEFTAPETVAIAPRSGNRGAESAAVERALPPPAEKLATAVDHNATMTMSLDPTDPVVADSVVPTPHFEAASTATTVDPAPPPTAAPTPATTPAPRDEPIATRKIAPRYPAGGLRGEEVRVEIAFGIDANGRVRNLRVLDGRSDRAFAEAATDALRAWRFDPSSVSADGSRRYRQTFVFAGERTAGALDPDGCMTRTGSRICQ